MSIARMSLIGSIMILAVVIFRAIGTNRLPKRAFIILWEIVLLRLLMPVAITLPILPPVESPQPWSYVQNNTAPPAVSQPNSNITANIPSHADGNGIAPSFQTDKSETALPVENNSPVKSGISLKTLYLAGVIGCAVFFALSYTYSVGKFSGSKEISNEYIAAWLKSHKSIRKITIRFSAKTRSPLTYGILRPIILLPLDTDFEDTTRLDYILEHEYTHIRHFDSLKKLIAAAALCLNWFNPLAWLMNELYNRDIELWCDECVIRRFGEDSKSEYARVLIAMEELKLSAAIIPVSTFGKSSIKERITSIMKFKKTTVLAVSAAVLLTAIASAAIIATSLNPVPKKAELDLESPKPVKPVNPADDPNVKWGNSTNGETYEIDPDTGEPKKSADDTKEDGEDYEDNADDNELLSNTQSADNEAAASAIKTIYDSSNTITDCRKDGKVVMPPIMTQFKGERTFYYNLFQLEKDDRAAIVFNFDHEPTDAEKDLDVSFSVFEKTVSDQNGGNSYFPTRDEMIITSKRIIGNSLVFLFEAPKSAGFIFSYHNCHPQWLYALDYCIELESDVTPNKFGDKLIEDFVCETVAYNDEEFEDYINKKCSQNGYYETVTDLTPITRDYAAEEDIEYIKPGEPFMAWYEINGMDKRHAGIYGYYGLTYTIEKSTVYDSWRDTGIPMEKFNYRYLAADSDMKCIVVDITAAYKRPSADYPSKIQPSFSNFSPITRLKGIDTFEDQYANNYYFSAHPQEGDISIDTGAKLSPNRNYNMFGKPILDGQKVSFQIVIFARESVIKEKALYLRSRSCRSFEEEDKIQYAQVIQ